MIKGDNRGAQAMLEDMFTATSNRTIRAIHAMEDRVINSGISYKAVNSR